MSFTTVLEEFFWNFYWEIILGAIIAILSIIIFGLRNRIRKWMFSRRVKPKLDKAINAYQNEILPEYVTTKPKIKVIQKTDEIPESQPFGYIFVPEGEEELIWKTLITFLPVSASLRRIKILFDEKLRGSLFDLLSYELGLKLGKENLAVKFRDNALNKYKEDFIAMEKVYEDRKLTMVILAEASMRYRKTNGHITTSEVEEFSTLVRKIAQIDASVVRIGKKSKTKEIDEIVSHKRGIVLLARGKNIVKAIGVSEDLKKRGYTQIPVSKLGLSNPEIGTWYFEYPKTNIVSYMRIWLQPSND